MLGGTMSVNDKGHLMIGGCDTVELAHDYGTPLYVLDEQIMRQRARDYKMAFASFLPGSQVIYAGKALLTTAICRIIAQEQLGLDVVSGGELYTALAADFPTEHIYFHGNNKSPAELAMAIDHGIGRIVVDNLHELLLLQDLAASREVVVDILLRIAPGVEPHTHSYIQTGQYDSKFGFPLSSQVALEGVGRAASLPNIRLRGLHCHIGSQIVELDSFVQTAQIMMAFLGQIRDVLGLELEELDLGGGLGIRYGAHEEPASLEDYAEALGKVIDRSCAALRLPLPKVSVEPGRSIVGEAGVTLYTVGSIKDVPGVRRYVAIDGGMADNPRVILYQARYDACLANKARAVSTELVTIAGKCCETGDMLIKDIMLPKAEPGDILAVFSTGAYNYSMASNYNRLPRPAMVIVFQGQSDVIVERETYADMIRFDRVPLRLAACQQTLVGRRG